MMSINISGGVGSVEITKKMAIKKYTFDKINDEDQKITYLIPDMFFMGILQKYDGFPKIIDVFKHNKDYCIKMPYLGKELEHSDDYLNHFTQIVENVRLMHHNNVIHGDLKLENILLDKNNIVHIIDFSHSKLATRDGKLPFCASALQTPYIMAPEAYNGKYPIGNKIDIWSLGCVLYELITDKCLFSFEVPTVIDEHKSREYIRTINTTITNKNMKKLLLWIYNDNPALRPSADEILEFLQVTPSIQFEPDDTSNKKTYHKPEECIKILASKIIQALTPVDDTDVIKLTNYKKHQMKTMAEIIFTVIATNELLVEDYHMSGNVCYENLKHLLATVDLRACFKGWYC